MFFLRFIFATLTIGSACHCSQPEPGGPEYSRNIRRATNIAYGGILYKWRKAHYNDSEIQEAVEYAVHYAQRTQPDTVPVSTNSHVLPYKLTDTQVLTLVFTLDGHTAHRVQVTDYDDTASRPQMAPLEWGFTYTFTVTWQQERHAWIHSFMVTQYWDDDLYMYKHTFRKHPVLPAASQQQAALPLPDLTEVKPKAAVIEEDILLVQSQCDRDDAECDLSANGRVESIYRSTESLTTDSVTADENTHKPQDINDQSVNTNSEHTSDLFHSESEEKPHIKYTEEAQSTNGAEHSQSKQKSQENIQLKILSFNVWNFNSVVQTEKAYQKRVKHLAKLCRQSKADIIGFQEVRFQDGRGGSWGPNQVEHLAKLLKNYQFVYQPAQIQTSNLPTRVEEGLAIFSKHPITSSSFTLLTRNESDKADGHQRILLRAEVQIAADVRVTIYNTHLSLSHEARLVSVQEIWGHLRHDDGPAFFMGDFNAEAHNEEVQFLQGRYTIDGQSTNGLRDVWMMAHGTDPGFTFNSGEKELTKRIDLIFMKEHKQVSLESVKIIDDGTRGSKAASDHLGLLAIFYVKSKINTGIR